MKQLIQLVIALLIVTATGRAQSFEGELTYKVSFNPGPNLVKMGVSKEMIIDKMKSDGEYYDTVRMIIKDGNYVRKINSSLGKWMIYRSDENKIYRFEEKSSFVTVADASTDKSRVLSIPEPEVIKLDTVKEIMGIECQAIALSWDGLGQEIYFYSPDIAPLPPSAFANHKAENLNTVLAATQAYPTEITRILNGVMEVTMTLVNYEASSVEEDTFSIPSLKKVKGKDAKLVEEMTGEIMMKIVSKK